MQSVRQDWLTVGIQQKGDLHNETHWQSDPDFWVLKLQLNFQERFCSEYRGHNSKAFTDNPLKIVELISSQEIYIKLRCSF